MELHFKRFSSSDEGLCDSVYTLSAFCLSALAIWAAKWGYYTSIVQVERLSKRMLVEPFPCPFSYFPPPNVFSLVHGSMAQHWEEGQRCCGTDGSRPLCSANNLNFGFFFPAASNIQIAVKATDAFLPAGAHVNICSHDAEGEWRLSAVPFHRGLTLPVSVFISKLHSPHPCCATWSLCTICFSFASFPTFSICPSG